MVLQIKKWPCLGSLWGPSWAAMGTTCWQEAGRCVLPPLHGPGVGKSPKLGSISLLSAAYSCTCLAPATFWMQGLS